jgi:hypothetical protein
MRNWQTIGEITGNDTAPNSRAGQFSLSLLMLALGVYFFGSILIRHTSLNFTSTAPSLRWRAV